MYKNTPLHYANSLDNTDFIEFLIKQCYCKIEKINRDGFKAKDFTQSEIVKKYYHDYEINQRNIQLR